MWLIILANRPTNQPTLTPQIIITTPHCTVTRILQYNTGSTINTPDTITKHCTQNHTQHEFNMQIQDLKIKLGLLQDLSLTFKPPPGFHIFKPHSDNSTAIITHHSIQATLNKQITFWSPFLSATAVDIRSPLDPYHQTTVVSVYRRDKKNPAASDVVYQKWLTKTFRALTHSSYAIGGDTNSRHPLWGHCLGANAAGLSLVRAVRSAGTATILNDGSATRASFLGSTRRFDKPSAIDTTVVSQGPVSFKNWSTHDQATSDHFMITFEMSIPHTVPCPVPVASSGRRLLSKSLCQQHEQKLIECLRTEAKSLSLTNTHITDAVDNIAQAFTRAADSAGVLAPSPNPKKPRKNTMTNQCIQLRRVKRKAELQVRKIILPQGKRSPGLSTEQLRSDPNFLAAKENLRNATRLLTAALRRANQERWHKYVADLDLSTRPTNVWKEIKKLQKASNHPQQAPTLANHEDTLWSPQDQCNALARHFSDISKNSTNLPKPVQSAREFYCWKWRGNKD